MIQNTNGKFLNDLRAFQHEGQPAVRLDRTLSVTGGSMTIPAFVAPFWSIQQRAGSPLHRIPYRDAFSPLLPRFFIERLTEPGQIVYDPFMGRGTAPLEAALLGRIPYGNDVNPLSAMYLEALLQPQWTGWLLSILPHFKKPTSTRAPRDLWWDGDTCAPEPQAPDDLQHLFHPDTLRQIMSLKSYLEAQGAYQGVEVKSRWLRLVVLARLAGHTSGYLSATGIPPNQALSLQRVQKKNERRDQKPPQRDMVEIIRRTTEALTSTAPPSAFDRLEAIKFDSEIYTCRAESVPEIPSESVSLIVTCPHSLRTRNYRAENWLRCWFVGIDPDTAQVSAHQRLSDWLTEMTAVFHELWRVLKPGGHLVVEVASLRPRRVHWWDVVTRLGVETGFEPLAMVTNVRPEDRAIESVNALYRDPKKRFDDLVVLRKGRDAGPNLK